MKNQLTFPLQVEVEGRTWRLFDVYFTDSDWRKYSFYIYAINREHASYVVEDIKRTAELAPDDIVGFRDTTPVQEGITCTLPLRVEVGGRTWRLFDVYFTDSDKRKYSFYIYAINREHASYIVEDIKSTAELSPDDIVGFCNKEPDQET